MKISSLVKKMGAFALVALASKEMLAATYRANFNALLTDVPAGTTIGSGYAVTNGTPLTASFLLDDSLLNQYSGSIFSPKISMFQDTASGGSSLFLNGSDLVLSRGTAAMSYNGMFPGSSVISFFNDGAFGVTMTYPGGAVESMGDTTKEATLFSAVQNNQNLGSLNLFLVIPSGGPYAGFNMYAPVTSVDVTVIPEPTTASMLGLGVLGGAWFLRRKDAPKAEVKEAAVA